MFDFVRKHTKIMQFVLFLLILPSFVFFGLDGYTKSSNQGEISASVDGRAVYASEWDTFHKKEAARLRETMPSFDPKIMDEPEAKYATLERLVRERVVTAAAEKLRIVTSDARLARDLSENETIAALRGPDGAVDMQRYAQLVAQQGMSPAMFEESVRRDLASRQVMMGVADGAFAPASATKAALSAYYDRREAHVIRFVAARYAAEVTVTEPEIAQSFEANRGKYQAPEQADVQFVVLDLEAVKKSIVVSPDDLKKYYTENKDRLAAKEERRARHILLTVAQDAKAEAKAAVRAQAQELLGQVRKTPASFADVATKNSQDPGSAPNGGDLDFFARGAMVKQFEEVAFKMAKGDISDVVETEFGFHIIQLTDIKIAKERTFEELRPELEADVKKQQAPKRFAEMAEGFTNLVFEQSDTLQPVMDRQGLVLRTQQSVTRKAPKDGVGPLSNQRFLDALFANDTVQNKRNTQAIEIGASQLVSGRFLKYTPARQLELAEVRDRVRAQLVADKSAQRAKEEGEKALAALSSGANALLPPAVPIARNLEGDQRQPQKVIDAVLRVDAVKLPSTLGVDLGQQGYAVVRVNKTLPQEAQTAERSASDRKQYTQWLASAELNAYYEVLKKQFKTEFRAVKPVAKAGADVSAGAPAAP